MADLVSIITPAYNAEKFLLATIQSVQAQTYPHWEMIIADDGSKDRTYELATKEAANDPRIKVIRSTGGNSGPAVARNHALKASRGRFVAFLDSDDLWLPHKLQTQVDFLLAHKAAFCFSQYRRITENGLETGKLITVPESITYRDLIEQNYVATLTTLIDRDQTGPFEMVDEGYDDFILWLDLIKRCKIAYGLQEDLARYRIVGGSVSRNKWRAAQWIWNIYRNVENLSTLKSAWYLFKYSGKIYFKHKSL